MLMIIILDHDINQTMKIIKNCEDIRINTHILKNWFERSTDFNYIEECIKNKIPLVIVKTIGNCFKLIHRNGKKLRHDLYIIIEINDNNVIEKK